MNKLISKKTVIESSQYVKRNNMEQKFGSYLYCLMKYCMEGPIVSIDVSNGNSHYMCFIKNNKRFGKVKKIDHDIE